MNILVRNFKCLLMQLSQSTCLSHAGNDLQFYIDGKAIPFVNEFRF